MIIALEEMNHSKACGVKKYCNCFIYFQILGLFVPLFIEEDCGWNQRQGRESWGPEPRSSAPHVRQF